jgi:nucleotide-binding universal stress UspA family protein
MDKDIFSYGKILAAVDLSKCSIPIIKKAKQIASQHNATLEVVHVVSMVMPSFSYSAPSDIQDTIYSEAKEHFIHFCNKYNIEEPYRHLFVGSPKQHILHLIESLNFDLLIVGSHGDHHIFPVRFGSISNTMVGKAKCDVLTVSVDPVTITEDIGNNLKEIYA